MNAQDSTSNGMPDDPTPEDHTPNDLWELHYGLLDEATEAALRERIATDEQLAADFENVKQQCDLLAEAARLEAPPVELKTPPADLAESIQQAATEEPSGTATSTTRSKPSPQRQSRKTWARPLNALVLAVAGVLVAVTGYSYFGAGGLFQPQNFKAQVEDLRDTQLRLVVAGPAELAPDAENTFHVTTTAVDGQPRQAPVKYRVVNGEGDIVVAGQTATDVHGVAFIRLPRGEVLGRGELKVETPGNAGEFTAPLKVKEVQRITHLSLDKTIYRPGETVLYRSLTLSRGGLRDSRELQVAYEVLGPNGAPISGSQLSGYTQRGVGNGVFNIQPNLPGGSYTLVVRSPQKEFEEQKKSFVVQKYRAPRLKKELEFTRDSYQPGDTVMADFAATRAEGGPAANAKLTIQAIVDGAPVALKQSAATTGANGAYQVQFDLPAEIENGVATLAVTVDDGGARETISKQVPINTGKYSVDFYPEGGEIVNGLNNRIYFHAYDPQNKPVHIEGTVVDRDGQAIAEVKTTHEGRGHFTVRPRKKQQYTLVVKQDDEEKRFDLPAPGEDQFLTLNTGAGIFEAGQPLLFTLQSKRDDAPIAVSATCRGVSIGRVSHIMTKNKPTLLKLPLPVNVAGVVRVTVYDYSVKPPKPIAERLVFRRPSQRLSITTSDVKEAYAPGDKVSVSVTVRNEQNQPQPSAVLGVAVVDDSVLNLADDKTAGMQTYFLLTSQIEKAEDLEDANFFLGPKPEAAAALDMLLGTQGWRKFVEKPAADVKAAGEDAGKGKLLAAAAGDSDAPALYDNLPEVQRGYLAGVSSLAMQRQADIRRLGLVCLAAGAGLILMLVILAIFKLSAGVRYWAPALAAATLVLAVGAWWTSAEVKTNGEVALAGFRSNLEPDVVSHSTAAELFASVEPNSGYDDFGIAHRWAGRRREFNEFDKLNLGDEIWLGAKVDHFYFDNRFGAGLDPVKLKRFDANDDIVAFAVKDLDFADHDFIPQLRNGRLFGEVEFAKRIAPVRQLMLFEDFERVAPQRYANPQGLTAIESAMKLSAARGDMNRLMQLSKLYEKAYDKLKLPVRQYAHKFKPGDDPAVRSDFTETVYWNPLLITDEKGQAKFEFELSAAVTSFNLKAAAHGNGRLGESSTQIVSRIPFSIEPKMPLELTAGDTVDLPVAVSNDSGGKLDIELAMEHSGLLTSENPSQAFALEAAKRDRRFFRLKAGNNPGEAFVELTGKGGKLSDAIRREVTIMPAGFPVEQSLAGRLKGQREILLRLPQSWTPGSLEASLSVYPSSLSQLQQGVEAILREPHGCFEQTSSSNYPNILALQYMQQHNIAAPEATRRAKELLKKGYEKLIGFESPKHGYEWFGGDPGHEALTAYGLMEFRDMSEVWDVDQKMVDRTAAWLLSRRDGDGGFLRNKRALDSFGGAPEEITNAYIVWALTESGRTDVDKELKATLKAASNSKDPYLIALAAGAALNIKKHAAAGNELLKKLAGLQEEDGHLTGTNGSITRSGGHSLTVETTALAALAWLKNEDFAENSDLAVQWLVDSRQGNGGFGSTQATVLALKALVEFADQNRRTTAAGEIVIRREGKVIDRRKFAEGEKGAIVMTGFVESLKPGDNDLSLSITGDNNLPFSLGVKYRTLKPANSDECPVRLTNTLAAGRVAAGETVMLDIELENITEKGQPMTTAITGIPAGLEANSKQLDELVEKGEIDYYELHGREIAFYWRSLAPKAKKTFSLPLVAEIPGSYTAPASRAYLYYTAEFKQWADPLEVTVERE